MPFVVATGDTISFYREFSWDKIHNGAVRRPWSYHALDTLTYSVVLYNAIDSSRITMVDSIGAMPEPQRGAPVLHGNHTIMAQPRFVVPAQNDGDTMYPGVNYYARGTGQYCFTRMGYRSIDQLWVLTDSASMDYVNRYGGGIAALAKAWPVIRSQGGNREGLGVSIRVEPNPTRGVIHVHDPVPVGTGRLSVVIFDDDGRVVFMPIIQAIRNQIEPSEGNFTFAFPTSGVYYVAVFL